MTCGASLDPGLFSREAIGELTGMTDPLLLTDPSMLTNLSLPPPLCVVAMGADGADIISSADSGQGVINQ